MPFDFDGDDDVWPEWGESAAPDILARGAGKPVDALIGNGTTANPSDEGKGVLAGLGARRGWFLSLAESGPDLCRLALGLPAGAIERLASGAP